MYLVAGEDRVVPFSEIRDRKSEFAYLREIGTSLESPHSIMRLIEESMPIDTGSMIEPRKIAYNHCLICPDGALPTKSLADVKRLKAYAETKNYRVKVAGSELHPGICQVDVRPVGGSKLELVSKVDWVIGVENEFLFEAIRLGIKTTLIPTGLGTRLYKFMCPHGEILELRE